MNRIIINIISVIISMSFASSMFSQNQEIELSKLFKELKMQDNLVFNQGFNNCDTAQLRKLLSDDLEFYHDQNGLLTSKEILLQNIPNLCQMNYKPTRVLVNNSLQVFPLYANGKIYGAIQTGIHEFYGEEEGKSKYLTSTAKFSHVWIIESGLWKLKRILSYDHQIPKS